MKIIMMMIALAMLTGCAQEPQDSQPTAQYCEMTKAYDESNGQWGWPDYKKIADDCDWRKS